MKAIPCAICMLELKACFLHDNQVEVCKEDKILFFVFYFSSINMFSGCSNVISVYSFSHNEYVVAGCYVKMTMINTLPKNPRSWKLSFPESKYVRSRADFFFLAACSHRTKCALSSKYYSRSCFIHVAQPLSVSNNK